MLRSPSAREVGAAREVEVPKQALPMLDLLDAHRRCAPDLNRQVGVAQRVESELAQKIAGRPIPAPARRLQVRTQGDTRARAEQPNAALNG